MNTAFPFTSPLPIWLAVMAGAAVGAVLFVRSWHRSGRYGWFGRTPHPPRPAVVLTAANSGAALHAVHSVAHAGAPGGTEPPAPENPPAPTPAVPRAVPPASKSGRFFSAIATAGLIALAGFAVGRPALTLFNGPFVPDPQWQADFEARQVRIDDPQLPDWVREGSVKREDQASIVLASGRFSSESEGIEQLAPIVEGAVLEYFHRVYPWAGEWDLPWETLTSAAVAAQHVATSTVNEAAGEPIEVKRVFLKIELTPELRRQLEPLWRESVADRRIVGLAGLALLATGCFATLAWYFRSAAPRPGEISLRRGLAATAVLALLLGGGGAAIPELQRQVHFPRSSPAAPGASAGAERSPLITLNPFRRTIRITTTRSHNSSSSTSRESSSDPSATPAGGATQPTRSTTSNQLSASFAGIKTPATRIVYIVDTSSRLAFASDRVVAELKSAFDQLEITQQVQLLCTAPEMRIVSALTGTDSTSPTARASTGNVAPRVGAMPNGVWMTPANRIVLKKTADGLRFEGNPTSHLAALAAALASKPDVVFLVTTAEPPELQPAELEALEQLSNGRSQVMVVEFGTETRESPPENALAELARRLRGRHAYVSAEAKP